MTIQVEAVQSLDIESAIAFQRGMYRDDTRIDRLVSRLPPTALDLNTGQLHVEDGARVGMTMSGRLLRYVGHPEGYGADFPWSKAYWHLGRECRKSHTGHRGEDRTYWRGNLCKQAVRLTVIGAESHGHGPLSARQAASVLRVASIDAVLLRCFRFIEERMDDFREHAERRSREDAGLGPGAIPHPELAHHVPSAEHVADCPNRECRSKRIA